MKRLSEFLGFALAFSAGGAQAAPTVAGIRAASYEGGVLPDGQSDIGVIVQVLLDRAGVSPGVVDGFKGGMTESALRAFEAREGLHVDGVLDPEVWGLLLGEILEPVLLDYIITEEDVAGLSAPLPTDYAEMAELPQLGFTSVPEKLAERFHMDEDLLAALNPEAAFGVGEIIAVTDPGREEETKIVRIEVDAVSKRLSAYDATGRMITNYPVTVGSDTTPSPSGAYVVEAVAIDPTYTYQPDVNFKQGDNDKVLILPPGPNGPVGSVWIDLSKPTYGIHGTPDPAKLFQGYSHGCIRLTNWDANELAHMVETGATVEIMQ